MAIYFYKKSIKTFKYHYTSYAGISYIMFLNKDYETAIKFLEKSIFVKCRNFPSRVYLRKFREEKKEEYFKKAVSFLYLLEGIEK